jgi:hypothetical protein
VRNVSQQSFFLVASFSHNISILLKKNINLEKKKKFDANQKKIYFYRKWINKFPQRLFLVI